MWCIDVTFKNTFFFYCWLLKMWIGTHKLVIQCNQSGYFFNNDMFLYTRKNMCIYYIWYFCTAAFFTQRNESVNASWPWMNETINTADDKAECMSHVFLLNYGKWTLLLRSLSAFNMRDWSNPTWGVWVARMSTRARNSPKWTSLALGLVCECVCTRAGALFAR